MVAHFVLFMLIIGGSASSIVYANGLVSQDKYVSTQSPLTNRKVQEMSESNWTVYLSGEIHTGWREEIVAGAKSAELDVEFLSPVTDHVSSDDCGVAILGGEAESFWHDNKGAKVNAIRTRTLIDRSDVVVVRFGDKYRQWNAAFDAGYAAARGKSIITIHDPSLGHALKEVDGAAMAVAENPNQVVRILDYAISGRLTG